MCHLNSPSLASSSKVDGSSFSTTGRLARALASALELPYMHGCPAGPIVPAVHTAGRVLSLALVEARMTGSPGGSQPATLPDDGDRLREECGVFGVFGNEDAAALTALGLHALQHRGQEAAGIVTFDGSHFHSERRLGLVGDNFNKADVIGRLRGHIALGHNRYSTTGETILRNVQPLFADLDTGGFAVAHNGNLTNALTLRRELIANGAICQSTSDTEVILHLISRSQRRRSIVERFVEALRQIEGAYALVCLTNDMLIGARDPIGIRPLVLGRLGTAYVLASETCALDIVGAEFVREIENGEIVTITAEGIESHRPFPRRPARPCIFEYIYFARPDSTVGGRNVYDIRKRMGAELALEAPANADVIIPIPDSGVPAAIGYSQASGIPFELGIIRNHYVGRTFIEPEQRIRQLGVKLKHSANASAVRGNRVVLIDDSVVRGTTSRKLVQMMFEAGAREVHLRVSSPPITHPDFYGIDTPRTTELLAANMSVEEMRDYVGATSLAFLSVDGTYRALGFERRDNNFPQFTDHCFTGDYPTELADQTGSAHTGQLSFLSEVR
jgi:amidophosphoribosyltransferase